MLKEKIKKIYSFRHVLWDIALKQLKARYSSSILGIFWTVINPLLMALVITFVFGIVFKVEIKNFHLFVISGIFPWMFFSNALSEATTSILNQQNILRQFNLPAAVLPLSSVLSNFLSFIAGWLIIYPLFLLSNPGIIFFLPLLILVLLLNLFFACGLGLILSVLNIFFRDIGHLLGILLMLWVWITPIFYSIDMVPIKFRLICDFNPMTPYIVYYREVIFNGNLPSLSVFSGTFFWAIFSMALGFIVFTRLESKILKRI